MSIKVTDRTKSFRHDLVAVTLAAAASAITLNANAAVDIFAKIGDIKGESTDDKHKEHIDVLSWSWGVVGAKKKGEACTFEMTVGKYVDLATPDLMLRAARGQVIPSAQLSVRNAGVGQGDFLVISMSDVIVTSVASGGAKELDRMHETLTLAFASATITYTQQLPTGGVGGVPIATVPASCAAFGTGSGRFPPS